MGGTRLRALAALLVGMACVLAARSPAAQNPPQQKPPATARPAGQAPPQQPQQPTFRTGINFVRVDVIVTDRAGQPITDLKQAEFEVFEDGVPQAIETFKLIEITGIPRPGDERPREIRTDYDEEYETSREDVRLFVIFLDDYHVRLGSSLAAREPLANFINNQVGAMDLVALMYPLTPMAALKFSRNRDTLVSAVRQFEGRKYNYAPRNEVEQAYTFYPAEIVERIRNEVTLSALESLVNHLGSLREGRKAVILVSEGFTNLLPPQLRDPIASIPGLGNPNRGRPGAGENDPAEERARWLATIDLMGELRDVFDAANKNNTTIYALDPRGLANFEFDMSQNVGLGLDREMLQSTLESLRILAENTDGRAIVNRNDLDTGLKQVVRDSSAYYLIGYNSTRAPADGKFHEIRVRLKRPGLQVRARKGYWALTAEDMKRAMAPPPPPVPEAVGKALTTIIEPPRGRLIRSWIGTARGEQGKTRVSFVWEPLPPVPGGDRFQPSQVTLVATGANRQTYFRGRVPSDAPAAGAESGGAPPGPAAQPRPASRVEFDVVPGPLELRISVHGRGADVVDTEVREMQVPDFTGPTVHLGTPAVHRAASAREFQAIRKDPQAMPTAGREFRRTDRLLIRFMALGPGGTAPAVSCRVLNRLGGAMADVPVSPPADGTLYEIDLPLAGLVSGEYLVEIKVAGADSEAVELVPFRIVA